MHDRSAFWSAVPDWSGASISADNLHIRPVTNVKTIWLVSGNPASFADRHDAGEILGPREECGRDRYHLRLAPDRLLHVSDVPESADFGWSPDGCAVTDVSDGMVLIDMTGFGSHRLMSEGCGYDFRATHVHPLESAMMVFAGIRLAVSRREDGWRLHVDRAMATALWRWLSMSAT